jgi:hypothetical protein
MQASSLARFLVATSVGLSLFTVLHAQDGPICGPFDLQHRTQIHNARHPIPEPGPGKAVIYFVRSRSMRGAFFQAKLAADGRWIGVLPRGRYYTFAEVDPGIVKLCGTGSSHAPRTEGFAFLTAQAGQKYYFEARLISGYMAGVGITELDEATGKALVAESKFVTFEEK